MSGTLSFCPSPDPFGLGVSLSIDSSFSSENLCNISAPVSGVPNISIFLFSRVFISWDFFLDLGFITSFSERFLYFGSNFKIALLGENFSLISVSIILFK